MARGSLCYLREVGLGMGSLRSESTPANGQSAVQPPSTTMLVPVTSEDASDARKTTAPMRSSTVPRRPSLILSRTERMKSGSSKNGFVRSEEHTSELQSLMRISYAVFFLKKKTKQTQKTTSIISIIKNLGQKINTINKYNRH